MVKRTGSLLTCGAIVVLGLCFPGGGAAAAGPSVLSNVTLESPTFHCLGVRCWVTGDANADAAVKLDYRRRGTDAWKPALDLFRVETAALQSFDAPPAGTDLFAGSVFNLEPDTEYELRLTMHDPDGGDSTRVLQAKTWKEPVAPGALRVLHVAPGAGGGAGSAANPLKGIATANALAAPGDLLLVHAGVYQGPVVLTKSGTAAHPIVWRSAGDGEAAFEGPADGLCVRAMGLRHVFFEGLSFRRCSPALRLGGSSHVTVRRCRFYDLGWGIVAAGYQERICIVDCVFTGIRKWPRSAPGQPQGEHRAVELSGIGHVVAYNRISGFRDAIDTRPRLPVRSCDFHNNDISECTDDGIELDFSETNCRAYHNRITNCFVGISFQPSRGGPNYAVRNVMYNLEHETYKLHFTGLSPTEKPLTSGGVILHNTVVRKDSPLRVWAGDTPVHHFFMRNNLYVVRDAERAIDMQCAVDLADWDYDVFAGAPFKLFGKWFRTFHPTCEEFVKATGQEAHGTIVEGTQGFFASGVTPPEKTETQYDVSVNDLRPAQGSPAVDRGTVLPNINDGFKGNAPDAGAYELGEAPPHYGPRPPAPDAK